MEVKHSLSFTIAAFLLCVDSYNSVIGVRIVVVVCVGVAVVVCAGVVVGRLVVVLSVATTLMIGSTGSLRLTICIEGTGGSFRTSAREPTKLSVPRVRSVPTVNRGPSRSTAPKGSKPLVDRGP